MKKILILTNFDEGLYNFRRELLKELVSKHEVYISLPFGKRVDELVEMGCKFIETPFERRSTNPFNDLLLLMKYIKMIKSVKPDVVLTYTIKPNVYGGLACQYTKTPYITNITGLGTAMENGGLLEFVTKCLYKIGLRKSKCVFFQNEGNKKIFVENKLIKEKSRLLPGSGVNLENFKLLEYPTDEKINLLFIGRIMKDKGIEELLSSAKYITEKYDFVEFHIVGFYDDDKYKLIIDSMSKNQIIHYHGQTDNVKAFIGKAHAIVLPSYHEGLSNVLLEASACGRPVLTTNVSGCKETFDEGITGYGCESKNSDDLTRIIEKFINLNYEEKVAMGIKARNKVEREFSRQIVVDSYMEEIGIIMEEKT